jgi:NADPH2:quinone reductase
MVLGGYADRRLIKADRLIKLPDGISDEVAAAATLQGLTAQYLVRDSYPIKRGDTVLVQAAAGGVGLMLCQWAKHLGATVIGTVSTDEKAKYAARHGCDHPIVYTREDFSARVKEITKGVGVIAVYDAVGKDTWEGSLACLGDFGRLVSYGESSGPVPPLETRRLGAKAQSFARGSLGPFSATPERRNPRAAELFSMIKSGALKIEINQRYKLAEAARAQTEMESRKTTGSSILVP